MGALADPNAKLGLDELAAKYGFAAQFFNSDVELQGLIQQAVAGQWTADKFKAAFMNTVWYRTKNADLRQWIELESRDPATASQRVAQQLEIVKAKAVELGVSTSDGRLQQLARDSLMFGWSEQGIRSALSAEWVYVKNGGTSGGAATNEDRVRQAAFDYGITLNDGQVGDYVGGIMSGRYSAEGVTDFIRDQARSKYPGLGQYLEMGFSVRQVADPYVQSYSRLLEKPPEQVDLNDPLVQKALQGTQGADGKPATQSLYDFEKGLRKDPRWLRTANAHDEVNAATSTVLRDFGLYS